MRKLAVVPILLAVTVFAACAATREAQPTGGATTIEPSTSITQPAACTSTASTDIAYASVLGVDPALLSLDVHPAPGACVGDPTPVVAWVHGGGWAIGDKSNVGYKATWAATHGWTFVSINYRLSPRDASDDPNRVMHPTHVQDVADALAWVADHIAEYGGDPSRVVLIGHSAGGHLVSLVSVDPTYLAHAGAPTDLVDCTVALDTEGYDLLAKVDGGEASAAMVHNAFGDDPAVLRAASPLYQITPGERLPRMLIVTRGAPARRAVAASFDSALLGAGGESALVTVEGYSHADVSRRLGDPTDTRVTPAVTDLVTACALR